MVDWLVDRAMSGHPRTRLRRQTRIAERIAGAVLGLLLGAAVLAWATWAVVECMGDGRAWR